MSINVKVITSIDPTSAKLIFDENGQPLEKILSKREYEYYQFIYLNDQIGISLINNIWKVVPSQSESEKNKFNWYVTKFNWCIEYGGFYCKTIDDTIRVINSFKKHLDLKVFS